MQTIPFDCSAPFATLSAAAVTCLLAAFLARRACRTEGKVRFWRLASASAVHGLGLWGFHLIGMLGSKLPIAVTYGFAPSVVSLSVFLASSYVFLLFAVNGGADYRNLLLASAVRTASIGGANLIGMSALQTDGIVGFHPVGFLWAACLGFVFSFLGLRLYIRRASWFFRDWLSGGVLLAFGAGSMQYAMMISTYIYPVESQGAVSVGAIWRPAGSPCGSAAPSCCSP